METKKIQLEIEGEEFECIVEFEFMPGEEEIINLLPENCNPGCGDYYEIHGVTVICDGTHCQCNFLLSCCWIEGKIIKQLEKAKQNEG